MDAEEATDVEVPAEELVEVFDGPLVNSYAAIPATTSITITATPKTAREIAPRLFAEKYKWQDILSLAI